MTAARLLVLAVVALPTPAAAQEAVSLEAPRPVRAQLNRLAHADPAVRTDAAAELGKDDTHAPFLRLEHVAAVTPAHQAALDAALAPIEARAWARHRDRVKDWADQRRFDLLAEYFASCPAADVPATIDHLLRVQQEIHREAWTPPVDRNLPTGFIPSGSMAEIRRRWPGWADAKRLTPTSGSADNADGWTFDGRRFRLVTGQDDFGSGALLAARDGLRLTAHTASRRWGGGSVVLANGPVQLLNLPRGVLVVADGDVEVLDRAQLRLSVVVTSGSVTGPSGPVTQGMILDAVGLHAPVGSIDLPRAYDEGKSHFRAGRVTATVGRDSRAERGVTAVSFGIRFVSTEDFGVRVEEAPAGLKVGAIEAGSPLARYDVRPGDVIARVGFDATRTADALRRALRRGLFEDAAVFHVVRGGERLTRVVYLNGLPRRP